MVHSNNDIVHDNESEQTASTVMRHVRMSQSMTEHIYDSAPIHL